MKRTNFSISLALALACAVAAGCSKKDDVPQAGASAKSKTSGNEAVELKPKWTAGKKFERHVEQTQDAETQMPGLPQPMKTTGRFSTDYTVTAVKPTAAGGWELEFESTRQQMDQAMGGTSMLSYDSQKDGGKGTNQLADARVKITTDSSGKAEKVEGFKDFISRMTASAGAQAKAAMQGAFTEESLVDMCLMTECLPDHAVKVGDSWPEKREVDGGPSGKVVVDTTCTFKGWEDHEGRKCALIEFTGTLSSKPNAGAASPMSLKLDNGTSSGKAWFDPELGAIVDKAGENTMTLKISAQGQDITSQVKEKSSAKLLKVSDAGK